MLDYDSMINALKAKLVKTDSWSRLLPFLEVIPKLPITERRGFIFNSM